MKLDLGYIVKQRRVRELEQTYIKNKNFHNTLFPLDPRVSEIKLTAGH